MCATSGQAIAATPRSVMNLRRFIAHPEAETSNGSNLHWHSGRGRPQAPTDVRFGSKADICGATSHVRFTPNSDRESGLPQTAMSALPPKADMCRSTSSCLLWATSGHSRGCSFDFSRALLATGSDAARQQELQLRTLHSDAPTAGAILCCSRRTSSR